MGDKTFATSERIEGQLGRVIEDYFLYRHNTHQTSHRQLRQIRTVLTALHAFVEKHHIKLAALTIETLDAFLAEYLMNYKESTCSNYRSCLRGFLNYLFHLPQITVGIYLAV